MYNNWCQSLSGSSKRKENIYLRQIWNICTGKVSTNWTYLGHEFGTSMDNSKVNGVSRRKSKQKKKQSQISLFFLSNSQQGTNTLNRYLYFRTYATLELRIFRTVPNRFIYHLVFKSVIGWHFLRNDDHINSFWI